MSAIIIFTVLVDAVLLNRLFWGLRRVILLSSTASFAFVKLGEFAKKKKRTKIHNVFVHSTELLEIARVSRYNSPNINTITYVGTKDSRLLIRFSLLFVFSYLRQHSGRFMGTSPNWIQRRNYRNPKIKPVKTEKQTKNGNINRRLRARNIYATCT